ncbi:Crp/Fnr family transcriptional regulator [Paucibacter sp. B2R-40]|uniref:Crp/Fnr family transcriptional regulator n=1 Tax=Paucibacter sp. B2R-40 TaxID=2893554 RepID=UPI0021E3DCD2|nr:Crp/Fnr family transcriptional regulator [Paucibacter sp. B2R-40]MCV2353389.1 Crp/Fnr family transcriptional regulator [Paucibacter sp. B2R-40]
METAIISQSARRLPRSAGSSAALLDKLLGPPRLSDAEMHALAPLTQTRQLQTGAAVFSRGQSAGNLVAVLDGVVGLGSAGDDQQFHLERCVHGPAWLDLSSAWLGSGHAQDARALQPSALLEFPLDGMRVLLERFPDMRERLMMALAQTVQSLTGATHDLMSKDAQKRLATWLLQRSPVQGADVALKERKRELAAQLAITPETLSRLLRQLMTAGLIEVKGYSIKLLNLAALQNLAHG